MHTYNIKRTVKDHNWGCCMLLINPENPDEMLVFKRAPGDRHEPNTWGFAGGKVDLGETGAEAVVREVKEETGLDVIHYSYIGSFHEGTYTTFVFVSTMWCGEIKLEPKECDDYEWLTIDQLCNPETRVDNLPIFSFTQIAARYYADTTGEDRDCKNLQPSRQEECTHLVT